SVSDGNIKMYDTGIERRRRMCNPVKKVVSSIAMVVSACVSTAILAMQSNDVGQVKLHSIKPGQYVHQAPTLAHMQNDKDLHPELSKVILKGRDLFMNTQQ